jgi:class 3 adenylate cyclase
MKQAEMDELNSQLTAWNANISGLLNRLLPKTISTRIMNEQKVNSQQFDSVTLCLVQITNYGSLCSKVSTTEVVEMFNSISRRIDQVIEKYDVYKIETTGGNYQFVSGIEKNDDPKHRGHTSEIAACALQLMSKLGSFVWKDRPDIEVQLRMGIHVGSVVGGLVGEPLPRFCLTVCFFDVFLPEIADMFHDIH